MGCCMSSNADRKGSGHFLAEGEQMQSETDERIGRHAAAVEERRALSEAVPRGAVDSAGARMLA